MEEMNNRQETVLENTENDKKDIVDIIVDTFKLLLDFFNKKDVTQKDF